MTLHCPKCHSVVDMSAPVICKSNGIVAFWCDCKQCKTKSIAGNILGSKFIMKGKKVPEALDIC